MDREGVKGGHWFYFCLTVLCEGLCQYVFLRWRDPSSNFVWRYFRESPGLFGVGWCGRETNLVETDVGGLLAEALTADVHL